MVHWYIKLIILGPQPLRHPYSLLSYLIDYKWWEKNGGSMENRKGLMTIVSDSIIWDKTLSLSLQNQNFGSTGFNLGQKPN